MEKLLLLGGSRYLLPVIDAAHKLGCHVITCDYLPDNIAHKYSDEYYNVSITDKKAVLELARGLQVDGILSFATDPGVTTAAYVCEILGLPTCPYQSVEILQSKEKFRSFLKQHGFAVPFAKGYTNVNEAMEDANDFRWPVMVKPVDSAGSKGVNRVNLKDELRESITNALIYSAEKSFIIEEFIEKDGYSSDSDCFSVDGKLVFVSFSSQRFDDNAENPYTPAAYSWPATMKQSHQKTLKAELQRLMTLLNMGTSVYNIETLVGTDGVPYIMEVAPRGGGNRLSEILYYATGIHLIENAVKAAVGRNNFNISQQAPKGYWAEYILHSDEAGVFQGIEIDDQLKPFLYEEDLWISIGEYVHTFTGANDAIGTLIFKFHDEHQLSNCLKIIKDLVQIKVYH